jgi:hypothetical protein
MSPGPDSDTSNKRVYERQEELRRDIERHVDPQKAVSSATDKAAIELGQSIVKTGTLLNGAAIIAIPSLVTFFGIETKAVMVHLIVGGVLFSAGLLLSWTSALFGFFALGSRSHSEHWFAEATYLRFHYSYFPPPDTDEKKKERMNESATLYEKAGRIYKHFKGFRAVAIILSLLSIVAFIAGNAVVGWAILHAPLKQVTPKPAVSASRSSSPPSIAGVLRPRRVFVEGLLISSLAAASGVGPSITGGWCGPNSLDARKTPAPKSCNRFDAPLHPLYPYGARWGPRALCL